MLFQLKPVLVRAFQWTGGPEQTEDPNWFVKAIRCGKATVHPEGIAIWSHGERYIVRPGDYVVCLGRGKQKRIHACEESVFFSCFEPLGG